MLSMVLEICKARKSRKQWRKRNPNNRTTLGKIVGIQNIHVGRDSYGPINVVTSSPNPQVRIGSYCSIAQEVVFITQHEHPTDFISTFPFKVLSAHTSQMEALSKGGIVVDDDVWIGYGATILDGVHIGQGAVVGARALITKDVPPYAIVGGVPAKVIRYRFDEDIIAQLLQVDYENLNDGMVREHLVDLYTTLDETTDLEWLPKKKVNLKYNAIDAVFLT